MLSMTGYGRGTANSGDLSLQVELKSVNNRFFNLRLKIPDTLLFLEPRVETTLRDHLTRGSVTCQVRLRFHEGSGFGLNPSSMAQAYEALNEFANRYELKGGVDLATVVSLTRQQDDDLSDESLAELETCLTEALELACSQLVDMRRQEGQKLKQELLRLTDELDEGVATVSSMAGELAPRQQEKLRERLDRLKVEGLSDSDLAREVALIADRSDISEEVTRLQSHLDQLRDASELSGPVGRKLDFVLQEVNREINTIGSKSSLTELTSQVIALKTVCEKIREQVQNVE